MEENEVLEVETELSDDLANAFEDSWDDDFESDEGSESDDGPVEDAEPEEREEGQPDADHENDAEAPAEAAEEPGGEDKEGNQLFEINYLGNKEQLTLDQMTELAQKGRDYDHVREERDGMRGKYGKYETFLQKLADKAGVSIDEQIDLTEAMWLMDEEADKGNSLTEAEALLRVQRNRNTAPEKDGAAEAETQEKINREIERFRAVYGDVKYEDIPKEVWDVANVTNDLLGAYQAYEIRQLKSENDKLKQSAQNERNAQRSTGPLKSTGSGNKRDAFDEGWDSE